MAAGKKQKPKPQVGRVKRTAKAVRRKRTQGRGKDRVPVAVVIAPGSPEW